MSSIPTIPLEVEEAVIDSLAQNDSKDLSSLKACSLVCKAFVPISRKHIFASVTLNSSYPKSATTRSLERLLSANPELADYIRHLEYNIAPEDLTRPSVQECLKRITRLQSLSISHYERKKLDWSDNPLRPALLHLLHLPTLIDFKVFAINNLVASDFIRCTNLKRLSIGNHSTGIVGIADSFSGPLPGDPVQLNEWVSGIKDTTVTLSICAAQRPDGRPVFDLNSLAKVTVQIEKQDDVLAVQELFKRTGQLTDVDITFWQPESFSTSLANLLRPSIQTLKHLHVGLHIDGVDQDPLAGIPVELENIREGSKNVLETLSIFVLVQTDSDCRTGEDWGKLDEVLTKSGWPKLREVSLAIEIASYSRQDKRLEEALRKLPEEQLARLDKSEVIEFKFDITNSLV